MSQETEDRSPVFFSGVGDPAPLDADEQTEFDNVRAALVKAGDTAAVAELDDLAGNPAAVREFLRSLGDD